MDIILEKTAEMLSMKTRFDENERALHVSILVASGEKKDVRDVVMDLVGDIFPGDMIVSFTVTEDVI